MKGRKFIFAIGTAVFFLTGCAPIVTSGPDVMIGGGIYPAPVLDPPLGYPPYVFRPGGPNGPGFAPGKPSGIPGSPNRPSYKPGNPGVNNPASKPGRPTVNNPASKPSNPSLNNPAPNPGNQRQPGTGLNIGGKPSGNPGQR